MQNISVCKVVAVALGILLGAGAALLSAFGLLPVAGVFFAPFIAVFSALVLLVFSVLFVRTSCADGRCATARAALCADGRFVLIPAVAALFFSLFASGAGAASALGIVLFAVFFGLAVLFFAISAVGLFSFTTRFCTRRCSCDCSSAIVPVSENN